MRVLLALPLLIRPVGDGAILGEVWADNWSSMSIDGTVVMEDSVSIDTESSFNAVSSREWRCMVTHEAPLNLMDGPPPTTTTAPGVPLRR